MPQIARFRFLHFSASLLVAGAAIAQSPIAMTAAPTDAALQEEERRELTAGWKTEKEARTLKLNIPAPRGQIVDRNGVALAQSRVAMYLALNFPFMGLKTSDADIVAYGRERIRQANEALGKQWSMADDRLISHYHNRRWLPLLFSISEGINEELTTEQQERIKPLLRPGSGLMLQAAYIRFYPKGAFAPHIIGYTGRVRTLPLTPIQDGDPLFEEYEGRLGLEKSFDRDLQGKPGVVNMLFNPDGTKADEQILQRPMPGSNVVTTLDYNFQKFAEIALARHTKGGAMVIMNVKTGDILAMASHPHFDPNDFIPSITSKRFKELNEDKKMPLYARAYQGEYPPASTFKVVVSLAALETGKITTKTWYDCSSSLQIGDRVFRNWNKNAEGSMNVVSAIKRSCNTWFYQAGMAIGADPITDMAQRLGFGERTGIPIAAESSGMLPTNAWMMQRLGHKMMPGDIANLSIGQGRTLVTPLQAAQSMAAVGDGVVMPKPRLVIQVQDPNDRVVQVFEPAIHRRVELPDVARTAVMKGMVAVVNGSGGTGRAAAISSKFKCQIAGKTGTAQWKPNEDRNLAWFTGFLPANDPLYAYSVVYEGAPGESVSGGKTAAPIVNEVFENIFKNASPDDPLLVQSEKANAKKAIPVTDEDEEIEGGGGGRRSSSQQATPVEEPPPPPKAEKRGFFRRLFGK